MFNEFTSHSGAFDTLNLASLDPGLYWDTSDLYSDGVLRVIPEPTSSILFLTGLAGLLGFSSRRRRV